VGKSHGIPVGPGRGSGAGSLVAWVLTITDLDPLRFGLLFERFLNPERVSMPDFDVDFCQERREEVIVYVQEKYGRDRVAQIITFGSLQARAVLRDVGRVMQLPLGLVDRLCKMVPNNPAAPVTLAQAIDLEPRLKQAKKEDANVSACLDVALQLEGLFRNASTHAAGVVIGDRPLTQLTPLYKDPRSDLPATQFNMKWVESAGLVKFDFLGLKTLTVLDRAVKHLKKRGMEVDLGRLSFDDTKSYELLASGQTVGVFQLESQGMRDTLRKMRCGSIEEITALISLYRPGPMDNIDTFVDCKFGRKPVDTLHPSLETVLKETYGVIVYQEQVMQIAQILAGYSLGEADLLRRAMGKKKKEEMDLQKIRFVSGAKDKGVPEEQSGSIFELVAKFAGYGFNKSHAAAYAFISYQTAWLKANTPVEFFAASMSLDLSNTDKLAVFHQDARKFEVTVRAPDVNASGADFEVENGEVLYALGAIRNVGLEAMKHLGGDPRGRRAVPRHLRLRRADRPQAGQQARHRKPGASRGLRSDPQEPRPDRGLGRRADRPRPELPRRPPGRAGRPFRLRPGAGRPRLAKTENWNQVDLLDEELSAVGFYLTGHPLEDVVGMLRRRRTAMLTEAMAQAEAGMEALRMCGVVRRRQERASQSGEKFAFVSLSDPTGEYEVLFPPEILRKCRDVLEPGKAVVIKVRAKARDGEVRFFGDDAEPIEKAIENVVAGLRVHLSPSATEIEALRRRLEPAQDSEGRGGDLRRRHRWRPRDRAAFTGPLHAGRGPARRAEDRARRGSAGRCVGIYS
jgi:DNA polymerase-3 subunit alpha